MCLKNSNCQELLTIPSGLQGQEQSSPRETQPPAPDHIFSTSQRGRGRARAALVVCSNTTGMKKKNSLLRLPDLGEEVGGKGAAAGARRARLGGWGGREPRTRGWETLPSPPLSLSLSLEPGRSYKSLPDATRGVPSHTPSPHLTGLLGILDLHGVSRTHGRQPWVRCTERSACD